MQKNKPIIIGAIGAIGLLIIYLGILAVANSLSHAIEQFLSMWYWISILVIGFGMQLGLYTYIRTKLRSKVKGATAEVATAGGISTGSMIACCAHHVTDVLPIVGLSAAAIFLVKYQLPFILIGIFSNLVGVTIMLNVIQKHNLYQKENIFRKIFSYNMKTVRNVAIVSSIIIVAFSFFLTTFNITGLIAVVKDAFAERDLPAQVNRENFVTIMVKPIKLGYNKLIEFNIKIDTHRGSLDFDLTEVSLLEDDKGKIYKPLSWEGSPPGGHHRSGILRFPKLNNEKTKFIKLIIKNVYEVPERVFKWEL